jgi:hypothetical protein
MINTYKLINKIKADDDLTHFVWKERTIPEPKPELVSTLKRILHITVIYNKELNNSLTLSFRI